LCNKIDVGDIVIAVDDKDVDASKVLEALRGSDKVGSECQITLKKQNGSQHKVALNRISTLEVFDIKVIMNNFIKMQSDVNRKVQDPEAQANMLQTIKDTRIVWESTQECTERLCVLVCVCVCVCVSVQGVRSGVTLTCAPKKRF
jgi:hypothetical protein